MKAPETAKTIGKTTALAISFDTTGSMRPCIAQVRQHLRDTVEKMTADLPGLKIGLIAHGDYCDGDRCISVLDLTDDLERIMHFITNTPNTSGGDAPECYELVLNRARSLSWPAEGGSLVLIGDDVAHEPDYPANTDHLDWRKESEALRQMKVTVFGMQCLKNPNNTATNLFWEQVSGEAKTPLLILESFAESTGTLEAVAYAAAGPEVYKGYAAKRMSAGVLRSSNLAENVEKLRGFTETKEEK